MATSLAGGIQLEPIFGRERELATLASTLESRAAGRGQMVLVSGEAGVGKTLLIEQFLAAAAEQGALTLQATCHDLGLTPPYDLWSNLFRAYHRLPIAKDAPAPPLGTGSGYEFAGIAARSALVEETLTFFAALASRTPVIIALEDLQWADDASLELLRALAVALERIPLLLVASFRDTEVASDSALYRQLPGLARGSRVVRIQLRDIPITAIEALLGHRYNLSSGRNHQLSTWLLRHSGGIPFFVVELLYNLEAEGALRREGDRWILGNLNTVKTPILIQQILDQRLERLSSNQTSLLQLAAVIGDQVPLEVWSTAAEIDDLELVETIEAGAAAGILAELPDGSGFYFPQALIRAALYNRLVLPRRRILHQKVGELLARQPSTDPEVLAHHFQMAGDPRARHWLIAAGRRAIESFAYGMAAERFEQALEMLGDQELSDTEQASLLCDLALSFRFADAARGLVYLDRAAPLARSSGSAALQLHLDWSRIQIHSLRGDNVLAGIDSITGALESADPWATEMSPLPRVGFGSIAQWYARYGAYERAERLARRYLDDHPAETSEDSVRAWCAIGLVAAGRGDPTLARQAFAHGRSAAAQIRDPHLTGVLLNWELMEILLAYDADQRDARRQLAASALEAWDRVDMPGKTPDPDEERPSSNMTVFATLLLDGEWETAREQAMVDLEFDGMRFDSLRLLCVLAVRRGNYADARSYLYQALPQGPATPPSNFYFYSTLWLQRTGADLALAIDDVDGAIEWIDAHDRWLEWSGRLLNTAESRVLRARTWEACGELETASRLASEAREIAGSPRQPVALIEAERYLGHLAAIAGDLTGASRHLDAALNIANACAAPYEIAGVQLARARLLVQTRNEDEAAEAIQQASEIAARLGIAPFIEQIERIESELDAVETAAPVPGGLSPRELEVLQLVARGMSDAETGDALFISPRTVSRHLRSIYNKLGVNSRTAASAFAYQHGLIEHDPAL